MGKIAVHEFITLDGVIDEPSWSRGYPFDPRMGDAIGGIMWAAEGLLLGRRTYEMFAPAWSARSADEPGALFMNESPKYVVSSTLESGDWNHTTIIGPYNAETIRELKERLDGNLYVSGSGTLVRALLADGLVDELHLFVYPLSLGVGPRLFDDAANFELTGSETYESGVVYLAYRPV